MGVLKKMKAVFLDDKYCSYINLLTYIILQRT